MKAFLGLGVIAGSFAAFCGSASADDAAFGKWANSQESCALRDGEGDTVTISAKEIFGLEWHCYIRDIYERKGYTVAEVNCGSEGEEFDTMIKYRRAGTDLLFKFGSNKEAKLTACAPKVQPDAASLPIFKRCHMDYCSFSQLVSREIVGQNKDGVLYKIGSKGFGREASLEEYETIQPPETFPDDVTFKWVFCSTTRPAVFFEYDNPSGVQIHLLAPGSSIYSGAETRSLQAYWATCHDVVVYEWDFTNVVAEKAASLSYSKEADSDMIDFASLKEAFDFLEVEILSDNQ